MKRRSSLIALTLVAGSFFAAAQRCCAGDTQASQQAARLVRQALQAEVDGNAAERERLLGEALRVDPNFEPAHWQLGEVRQGNKWMKVEEVGRLLKHDRLLKAYRERRDSLLDTADAQRELARWCEKRRLPDQARVHWARVLEFEPANGEALRGANVAQAEALTRHDTSGAAKRHLAESNKNVQTWQPKLREWLATYRSGVDGANRAVKEITQINDPTAAPALQAALGQRDFQEPRLREALYEGLGNLRVPEVTQYFVGVAMYGEGPDRDAAIAQLKRRPMYGYVPQLLAAVPPDLNTRFNIFVLPNGGVLHEHEVAMRTTGGDYSYKLENFVQPADQLAAQRATPLALAREVTRAQTIQNEAKRIEVAATDLRNRIRAVLAETTDLEVADDALDWEKQYEEYYGLYTPQSEREYRVQRASSQEGYFTPPVVAGTGKIRMSCFVAGTDIVTELGSRAIEQLKQGDRVLSQNIATGELSFRPLLARTVRPAVEIVEIHCGNKSPLQATPGHPFWVVGKGWELARLLKPGDRLYAVDGSMTIDRVERRPPAEGYNLVVDGFHTYFAGENQLLVHDNEPLTEQPQLIPGL